MQEGVSHHFCGFTPSQSNFESLAELDSAGAMEKGVMVAADAVEEEGAAAASITPKATRVWKMPKKIRKIGQYASRGKQQQIHWSLGPHPNPQNPPSQVSATLPCYVRPNSLLRILKAELATELKSAHIKITLDERKLERKKR